MTSARRRIGHPVVNPLLLLVTTLAANVLEPESSQPPTDPIISVSTRQKEDGTEDLSLLLADHRVMVVSRSDSLTGLGRAADSGKAGWTSEPESRKPVALCPRI
jgi:hypothetical protein